MVLPGIKRKTLENAECIKRDMHDENNNAVSTNKRTRRLA